MFKNPFSFDGRIRRTEYGLSLIFYGVASVIVNAMALPSRGDSASGIVFLAFIPMVWFLWAQGAKRCHDLDNSGWWQLIPFYGFWLLFAEGKPHVNQYGSNPKETQIVSPQVITNNTGPGYQGGYNGGHNNHETRDTNNQNQSTGGDYKSGELYK